jgi:hypothetical protein
MMTLRLKVVRRRRVATGDGGDSKRSESSTKEFDAEGVGTGERGTNETHGGQVSARSGSLRDQDVNYNFRSQA